MKKVAFSTSTATEPTPILQKHVYKIKRKKKINTRSSRDECSTDFFFQYLLGGVQSIMSNEH